MQFNLYFLHKKKYSGIFRNWNTKQSNGVHKYMLWMKERKSPFLQPLFIKCIDHLQFPFQLVPYFYKRKYICLHISYSFSAPFLQMRTFSSVHKQKSKYTCYIWHQFCIISLDRNMVLGILRTFEKKKKRVREVMILWMGNFNDVVQENLNFV